MFNLYFCNVHKSFPSDTNPVITNNGIGKIRSNIHDNHNETLCTQRITWEFVEMQLHKSNGSDQSGAKFQILPHQK